METTQAGEIKEIWYEINYHDTGFAHGFQQFYDFHNEIVPDPNADLSHLYCGANCPGEISFDVPYGMASKDIFFRLPLTHSFQWIIVYNDDTELHCIGNIKSIEPMDDGIRINIKIAGKPTIKNA